MHIDSSAAQIRTTIANQLIALVLDTVSGEEAALDLAELIAVRMPGASDDEVAVVGFYVRANLVAMLKQKASYCEILHRLSEAAVIARLGPIELKKSIEAGLDDLLH